jgi:hypothetical protein
MNRPFRIPLRLACALVGVAVLAGCGASGPSQPLLAAPIPSAPGNPDQSVNFRGARVPVSDDASVTLPLDAFDLPQNWQAAEKAMTALAQECMSRMGMAAPAELFLSGVPGVAFTTLYGVVSLDSAEHNGYLTVAATGTAATAAAAASSSSKYDASVTKAMLGDPQRGEVGCRGEAAAQIGMQKAYDAFTFVQELRARARDAAAWHDSRVNQANSAWSACMKVAGYTYPDPTVPPHDTTRLGRGLPKPPGSALPPPSPAEKAVAVADVKCKRRVNYLQTVTLVTAAYQQFLIAQQATALHQGQEAWHVTAEAAEKIIATAH